MGFTLTNWLIYTMWGIFGLMIIDFLIAFIRSFWEGSLKPNVVLDYLKDVLYYVLPLNIVISMMPIDPTGWTLAIFYFIGGIALMLKYILDIVGRFRSKSL